MKIAIVTPTFPPYAGGIGNVAAANAATLAQLGHQVTVVTPLYQPVQEAKSSFTVRRVKPLLKYGNAAVLPGLTKMLDGYDIIHLHYPFFGTAEILWLRQRTFKIHNSKFIIHYHMDVVGSGFLKTIFSLHTKLLLPKIISAADRVLLTSLDYGRNSNIAGLIKKNPDKFVEVPNGIKTQFFQPGAKNAGLMNRYGIGAEEKVILFVGGLDKAHYFKGVEYLIEAASRLKQTPYRWKLIIVGEGELKQSFIDLAGQLTVSARTIFTGYVAAEQLPAHYQLADVVVLPSIDKSEAFGLALVEAMACARPVIASDLPGVRSVVDNQQTGLLAAVKNPDDLAGKIDYLLRNPDIATQYGLAGRQKVEAHYAWEKIAVRLEKIYG